MPWQHAYASDFPAKAELVFCRGRERARERERKKRNRPHRRKAHGKRAAHVQEELTHHHGGKRNNAVITAEASRS